MLLILLNHTIRDPITGTHRFKIRFQFRRLRGGGNSNCPMNSGIRSRGLRLAGVFRCLYRRFRNRGSGGGERATIWGSL